MWRRVALAVAVAAGAACAEPRSSRHFELYLYEPLEGPNVYALKGADASTAAEIEGCSGRVLTDARSAVDRIDALRAADRNEEHLGVVTVSAGGSIHLGSCSRRGEDEEKDDDEDEEDYHAPRDSLVILESMTPRQTRMVINEMDALSREQRAQMRAELGLN